MKQLLKLLLPQVDPKVRSEQRQKRDFRRWQQRGCPIPPPHFVKQLTIREYKERHPCNILVETGTYLGDMVEAQKEFFGKIFSIELSDHLFQKATLRFKDQPHITIVHGDSGRVLPAVMEHIDAPALFWLDGHYSHGVTAKGDKDCPIFEELNAIFAAKEYPHVLLIDDARLFNGTGDYPTLDELDRYVSNKNQSYRTEVKDDIIRCTCSV